MEFFLTGVIGGILAGLFGVGGGSIYVPALVLILGCSQHLAQGISLLVIIPTSFLGGYIYLKRKLVTIDIMWELMIGGVIGAFLGGTLANYLDAFFLRKMFGVLLLYFGFKMVRNSS